MEHLDFENPPLISTLMEVQFQPPPEYNYIHAQNVWALFQPEFPIVGIGPISQPMFEEKEILKPQMAKGDIITNQPLHPRYLFQHNDFSPENGGEVLHFEGYRFARSWQADRYGQNQTYPHYQNLREKFKDDLQKLEIFFVDLVSFIKPNQKDTKLEISQASIRYDNRINLTSLENKKVSDWFENLKIDELSYESFLFNFSRKLNFPNCYVARGQAKIGNVIMKDDQPGIGFTLAVNANLNDHTIESAMSFFDQAHDEIIDCFNKITTEHAKEIWGAK